MNAHDTAGHTTILLEKRHALAAGISLLLLLSILAGCNWTLSRQVDPLLLEVDGESLVTDSAHGAMRSLDPEFGWKVGENLHTRANATTAFSLLPGALLRVEPNSDVTLKTIRIAKDGNAIAKAMSRTIRLELLKGGLLVLVQFEPKPAGLIIHTPHGSISADERGVCRVEVSGAATRLTCLRGAFSFTPREGRSASRVEGGYFLDWLGSSQPPAPVESDARAQGDVENSLMMERKLLELQRRTQHLPFQWRQP